MYEDRKTQVQARKPRLTRTDEPPLRVVATFTMDITTFIRHFNNRHKDGLGNMGPLPEDMAYQDWQRYLAYHRHLHQERRRHYHDPDPPEAGIDRAIECLSENRDWGWKEIAGVYGYVAAFPDGQLATRVDGIVFHHKTIEDATDRLVTATKRAKKVSRR